MPTVSFMWDFRGMSMETAMFIESHYRTPCRPARWGKRPWKHLTALPSPLATEKLEGGGTPHVL